MKIPSDGDLIALYNETLHRLPDDERMKLITRVVDMWHDSGDSNKYQEAYRWGIQQALAILGGHSVASCSDEYDEIMLAQEIMAAQEAHDNVVRPAGP